MINLIVCVDRDWGIGNNGGLLFMIEQDMEFFRNMTQNKAVVMGRKTFDSLPRPLKNRTNIVLTKDMNFNPEGVVVCHTEDEVLEEAKKYPEVFVIGGGEIYSLFLPYCQRAYVTKVNALKKADAHMVNLDKEKDWKKTSETKDFTHGEFAYWFSVYEKINR